MQIYIAEIFTDLLPAVCVNYSAFKNHYLLFPEVNVHQGFNAQFGRLRNVPHCTRNKCISLVSAHVIQCIKQKILPESSYIVSNYGGLSFLSPSFLKFALDYLETQCEQEKLTCILHSLLIKFHRDSIVKLS